MALLQARSGNLPDTRPIAPADHDFLRGLYASTRAHEAAATGWPPAEQQAFLAQQFELQHRYYREHYADADFLLLLRTGQPIGRLYWRSQGKQATLIDLSLLPAERGRGIGTAVMGAITEQADRLGQTVHLHVEPGNPAHRLYRRFGFDDAASNGVYAKMHRLPRTHALEGALS